MNIISKIDHLIDNYDFFAIDLWGVIHDGTSLYPNILDFLNKLNKLNKKIYFISNAPRRSSKVAEILSYLGIDNSLYIDVITSGETSFSYINNNLELLGRNYFYIGPDKDIDILKGIDIKLTQNIKKSDFAIVTGYDENETIESKLPLLKELKKNNLKLICANPDMIVVKQNYNNQGIKELFCAGLIAKQYKDMGGEVIYFGKPYNKIYDFLFNKIQKDFNLALDVIKENILFIGDSLNTDVKGAINYNCDNLFVTDGIHMKDLDKEFSADIKLPNLKELCNKYNIYPKYVISNIK